MSYLWACDWVGLWEFGRDFDTAASANYHYCRLGLQIMSFAQDDIGHIWDILASFFYSGRKCKCVVHLFFFLAKTCQHTIVYSIAKTHAYKKVSSLSSVCAISLQKLWMIKNYLRVFLNPLIRALVVVSSPSPIFFLHTGEHVAKLTRQFFMLCRQYFFFFLA